MDSTSQFRQIIKAFINEAHITVNALAIKAGIDPSGLARFVADENRTITLETMDKLKKAMK